MLPCHLILRLLFRCESWTQCEHMWRMCVSTASMLCEILLSTYRQYTDVSTRVLQSVYVSFSSTTGVNTHVYFSMNSMHALKTHEYSSYFTNTTTYKKWDILDLWWPRYLIDVHDVYIYCFTLLHSTVRQHLGTLGKVVRNMGWRWHDVQNLLKSGIKPCGRCSSERIICRSLIVMLYHTIIYQLNSFGSIFFEEL